MPIVQIELIEGRTVEQKRALVEKVTKAVVESVGCPESAVS
ncbi:MAG: 2-hydroxymuconate tautomerase, partial [Bacillota bacterium]|nr:2-hydroxymuconate tautomerase [Bacillota bacterium]